MYVYLEIANRLAGIFEQSCFGETILCLYKKEYCFYRYNDKFVSIKNTCKAYFVKFCL